VDEIEELDMRVDGEEHLEEAMKKLAKGVREFRGYVEANEGFIPNYGER
jgi:hypothetical protein